MDQPERGYIGNRNDQGMLSPGGYSIDTSQSGPSPVRNPSSNDISKLKSDMKIVKSNVDMINELLDTYTQPSHNFSEDDKSLLEDLIQICQETQKTIVNLIPSITDEIFMIELVNLNDEVLAVMKRHTEFVEGRPLGTEAGPSENGGIGQPAAPTQNSETVSDLINFDDFGSPEPTVNQNLPAQATETSIDPFGLGDINFNQVNISNPPPAGQQPMFATQQPATQPMFATQTPQPMFMTQPMNQPYSQPPAEPTLLEPEKPATTKPSYDFPNSSINNNAAFSEFAVDFNNLPPINSETNRTNFITSTAPQETAQPITDSIPSVPAPLYSQPAIEVSQTGNETKFDFSEFQSSSNFVPASNTLQDFPTGSTVQPGTTSMSNEFDWLNTSSTGNAGQPNSKSSPNNVEQRLNDEFSEFLSSSPGNVKNTKSDYWKDY